ncbi:MAG TPA: hypothetical protein VNO30_07220 [Kofleriaceae bacterium]|nr:hypothetical protein [Kofleriaceae bacterium]
MRIARIALLGMGACAACAYAGCGGSPAARPDAAGNGPGDAGACGIDRFVTGELVDLDSTTALFKGVLGARLTVEGVPARSSTTAPNGRFQLCAPPAGAITLDVDAPGDYLDGKAYIEAEALGAPALSLRTYTRARGAALYAFDPSRGHVLIYLAGDRSDLTLSRAHGAPLAGNDDDGDGALAWEAGNAGRYVLFPNVDVSSPTIELGGDPRGPHTLPVAAGQLTLAAIFFVYF